MATTEAVSGPEPSYPARFSTIAALYSAHAQLLKHYRDRGTSEEPCIQIQAFMNAARETGVLLDDDAERFAVQSMLNYWSSALYRAGFEPPDATLVDYDFERAPELEDSLCPYGSLDALAMPPGDPFSGWQRLLEESLSRLKESRLLVLVGATGSGRSTFVRSVLLPTLRSGRLSGSEKWRYLPVFSPGAQPLGRLVGAVLPEASGTRFLDEVRRLREDVNHLTHQLDRKKDPAVLIVDHFEELFYECPTLADRQALADNLFGAIKDSRHIVILVMKRESATHLRQLGALEELVQENQVVFSFTAAELREAILEPARRVGLNFDEGLVDRLVLDIQGDPAALALLQFSLQGLWEHRTRNRITWDAYQRVGAGSVALERAAERLYHSLSSEEQRTLRAILVRMVGRLSGREVVAHRVSREDINKAGECGECTQPLLDKLVAARLVYSVGDDSADGESYVLAHEALIDHWPQLSEWLEDEAYRHRQRLRLAADAGQWAETHKPELLWRGLLLQEALSWELTAPAEVEFVAASQQAAARSRNRVIAIAITSAILAIVASGAAVYAFQQRQVAFQQRQIAEQQRQIAEQQRQTAQQALGQQYVAHATPLMKRTTLPTTNDLPGALLWISEALALSEQNEDVANEAAYRTRLGAGFRQLPRLAQLIYHPNLTHAALSPDGYWVATASEGETSPSGQTSNPIAQQHGADVRVWHVASGELVGKPLPHSHAVNQIAFKALQGVDLPSHLNLPQFGYVPLLLATASGKPGGAAGRISVWSLASQPHLQWEEIWHQDLTGAATAVRFSPAEDQLRIMAVVETGDKSSAVQLWDISQPSSPPIVLQDSKLQVPTFEGVNHAFFTSGGSRIVTASGQRGSKLGSARIWDAQSGMPQTPPLRHDGAVLYAAVSSDGTLVTASEDMTARLWDTAAGVVTRLLEHDSAVNWVGFTPDAQLLVTATSGGTVRIWHHHRLPHAASLSIARPGELPSPSRRGETLPLAYPPLEHGTDVFWAAISPDGLSLVTCCRDQKARVWNLSNGELLLPPMDHSGSVTYAEFSPEGRTVVMREHPDSIRVWNLVSGNAHAPLLNTEEGVNDLTVSDDQTLIATVSGTSRIGAGEAQIWNAATGEPIGQPLRHDAAVIYARFSHDGRRLFTATDDRRAGSGAAGQGHLWDVRTGRKVAPAISVGRVNEADFNADTSQLAIAGQRADGDGRESGVVTLWKLSGDLEPKSVPASQPARCLAFSPDGELLVVGFGEYASQAPGEAKVWDVANNRWKDWSLKHKQAVLHVACGERRRIVTTSEDDRACVWDATSGHALSPMLEHTADVVYAAFAPGGERIVTASMDQRAMIWKIAGKESHAVAILEHDGWVSRCCFDADGKFVATASSDRTARIWDAQTGDLISLLPHPGSVIHVGLASKSHQVVTACYRSVSSGAIEAVMQRSRGASSLRPASGRTGAEEALLRRPQLFTWDISPAASGSARDLSNLAQVASARHLSKEDGMIRNVSPLRIQEAKLRWVSAGDDKELLSAVQSWPSHERLAADGEALHQWFAAAWHLKRAIAAQSRSIISHAEATVEINTVAAVAAPPSEASLPEGEADQTRESRTSSRLYSRLARAQLHLRQFEQAAGTFDLAASRGELDGDWRLWAQAAQAYGQVGQQEKATSCFAESLELASSDPSVRPSQLIEQALAFSRLNRWAESAELYALAVEAQAGVWWLWERLAEAYQAQGEWKRAAECFETAGDLNAAAELTDCSRLWASSAAVSAKLQDWESAIRNLKKAVDQRPAEVDNWYWLALVQLKQSRDHDQEPTAYRRVCREMLDRFYNSNDFNAWNTTAWTCSLGADAVADMQRAVELAQLASDRHPGAQMYLNTLGAALYRQGRFAEAIERLHEARRQAFADLSTTDHDDGTVWDFMFLALAYQAWAEEATADDDAAAEHSSKALQWFRRATQLIDDAYRDDANVPIDFAPWNVQLELELLRAEAADRLRPADESSTVRN